MNYELGGTGKVANLPTVELRFKAKTSDAFTSNGTSKVYDEYSFPLASDLTFRGPQKYSFEFKEITFNSKTFSMPTAKIPSDAIVSKWDMDSKAYTEEAAKKEAGFGFVLPRTLPQGLVLSKIIRQEGPIPAFTASYRNTPYSLS
ncbi:MAG: hypothetical protein AAB250_14025, partial [Bdellovibrionota bacterium]